MSVPHPGRRRLAGWGNHPVAECLAYRPERSSELEWIVESAPQASVIGRGMGRSYGDASLNDSGAVVLHERLNRMIAFDAERGILECEAGVGLWEILEVFGPRGFFFPVTPGTKYISVGGAIAADVHGKNHHRQGSISRHVIDFRLLTAAGEILTCSPQSHPDLFWATMGGMGLTGLILDARLRLSARETAPLRTETERTRDLDSTLECISERDGLFEHSVAWIDCLSRGRALGRSVLMRANSARRDELPKALRERALSPPRRRRPRVPIAMPRLVFNSFTMRLFNAAWYAAHRDGSGWADYERYFYPLDALREWNRLYGRRGVVQYQIAVPTPSAREALISILESVSQAGDGSFLAVLKSLGPADDAPLGFPLEGLTISLDLPYSGPSLIQRLHALDEVVLRHGGRVYLAKDSCLRPEHVPMMYPRLDAFRAVKERVDPQRRFDSALARRLGLSGPA